MARASYIVSTVGIVLTIVGIAIWLGVYFGIYYKGYNCHYHNGICYHYKSCYDSYFDCSAHDGVYYGSCCYYN